MADQLTPKDLAELKQLYKDLHNIDIPNINSFVKELGMEGARKNLEQLRKEFQNINSDITYLVGHLKDATREVSNQTNAIKDTRKSYNSLTSIASKLKYDQDGISRLNKKDLESISKKVVQERQNLEAARATNIERAKFLKDQLRNNKNLDDATKARYAFEKKSIEKAIDESDSFLTDTTSGYNLLLGAVEKRIDKEKLANKALGASGALVNGLSKAMDKLGLGSLVNLDRVKEKMQDVADNAAAAAQAEGRQVTSSEKLKVLTEGLGESFASMGEALADPALIIPLIVEAFKKIVDLGFKADNQTTDLAKSLMQTKNEAADTREQFVEMSRDINDAYINTNKLIEANAALGKQLGFNKVFSQELDETFIDLTKKIGLSEEAAGGLARISIATGRTLKSTEQTIAATTSRISAQNGVQLDGKDILEESGKISGQLLANFKANPGAIAEAVAQTRVLGTTLEKTKLQSEKLLDFESSISNQLKAELLTGQQLNLERARTFALQGDQVGVAKELANQGMNFNKFSRLNVIQQKAFAEALGTTSDALADQLLKQQAIGKSRAEIVALGGEEAAKRLEALSAQEKFNAAAEKYKELITNLISGPFGEFLNMMADIVGLAFKIINPLIKLVSLVLKPTLSIYSAIARTIGAGVDNVGGSFTSEVGNTSMSPTTTNDMAGYGANSLVTPSGVVALNNNDTVIAGTNLVKGDDITSFPKGVLGLGGDTSKIENLLERLINKNTILEVNGRTLATESVRSTYKSA